MLITIDSDGNLFEESALQPLSKSGGFACPNCGKNQERRFNMPGWNHPSYHENGDQPFEYALASQQDDIASPSLWTDGIWGELEEDEKHPEIALMPCQGGDAVLICGDCRHMFLMSDFLYSTEVKAFHYQILDAGAAGADFYLGLPDRTGWIFQANPKDTLSYFEQSLDDENVLGWESWTAAQQTIFLATDAAREGIPTATELDEKIRVQIARFMDRKSDLQVKNFSKLDVYEEHRPGVPAEAIGELGYLVEPDEAEIFYRDEYYVLANMSRITGAGEINFDAPKNSVISEYYEWRAILLKKLCAAGDYSIAGSLPLDELLAE